MIPRDRRRRSDRRGRNTAVVAGLLFAAIAILPVVAPAEQGGAATSVRAHQFERAVSASRRLMLAWLALADPRTLLLPDRPDAARSQWVYTPHNSGADLYPYLILTADLTDPDIEHGRMMEMLRNEIRFTNAKGAVPGNLNLSTGELSGPSLFGAGEYAKDGLIAVTEYLGRTPWFARMADMMADAMAQAAVPSRFGPLPAEDAELNGDYLQTLVRLYTMTLDERYLAWARRIGDAYIDEVLPANGGVPAYSWNFSEHRGSARLRLRDHGNETVVGLTMLFTLEDRLQSPRAAHYRPAIQRMLDRILASANADGMLYNEVDPSTLAPIDARLSDNWGYVYGAVYAFYQATGEVAYRDAVRRVLRNLPRYHRYVWEPGRNLPLGSFDGYADTIESAIYLVNREPVPEAFDWIDSEMDVMLAMQRPDGRIEDWYGEGNFNRTALLYAYMKSQGVRPVRWEPGVGVGAVQRDGVLHLALQMPAARRIRFDDARHRRILNLEKNYVRLNEFPEWFVVDENRLYRLTRDGDSGELIRLGSELVQGVELAPGAWSVEPYAQARGNGASARSQPH